MARDTVTVTALTQNAGTTNPVGTTITPANDAEIDGTLAERMLIRVTNTHGTAHPVVIKAGVNPPAFRSGLGDLSVTVPLTSGDVLIPIESARFMQADGKIHIDFETDHAGKISAIALPKV